MFDKLKHVHVGYSIRIKRIDFRGDFNAANVPRELLEMHIDMQVIFSIVLESKMGNNDKYFL